jgi:hypothetical protein
MKRCPFCLHTATHCPECGKEFNHGETSHCDGYPCIAVNAPLDCDGCGRVVASDCTGVLDFDMNAVLYGDYDKDSTRQRIADRLRENRPAF